MESSTYTYYEDDNMRVRVEEAGGYAFIHVDIDAWDKKTCRFVKTEIKNLFLKLRSEGYEWAFATSDKKKSVKFWNMAHKCHTVKTFGDNDEYWIGSWKFEDVEWV